MKWYIPEIQSTAAARLLDPEIVLCAPDLIGPELVNAIWKKVRRAEITRDEGAEILRGFGGLPIELRPSADVLPAAFEIALQLDRSVYDSLYLALAVAEEAILVTADAMFHTVVAASPLASYVQWVEDVV